MRRSAASWMAPLGVALLVVVILVVVGVVSNREDDTAPTSVDPSTAGSTTSAGQTPTETISPSTVPGVNITKPAKGAAKDGFPVLVPAEVPPGWVATDAVYTPAKGNRGSVWQVTFQLPDGGVVVLTQSELGMAEAVQRYLGAGAERTGKVDLRKWGTGYWFAYTVGGGTGIAKQLPTETSVVVAAPLQDDAVTLAKQLLTFEDYDSPEG